MRFVPLLLLLWLSARCVAQPLPNDLPFPRTTGIRQVIKLYEPLEAPRPGQPQRPHDTDAVYLIDGDGYAAADYYSGYVGGKHTYAYDSGRLTARRYFDLLTEGETPRPGDEDGYRLTGEKTWEYEGTRVSVARNFHGPDKLLTEAIRYRYDGRGRPVKEYRYYPDQKVLSYPSHYDSVVYRYRGDSVTQLSYERGGIDTFSYLKRRNRAGRVTELYQISKDRKHFTHEWWTWNAKGGLQEYRYASDWPVVQPDGTVLRADRVVYTYDKAGRLLEETCYAAGVKRWAYRYVYVP